MRTMQQHILSKASQLKTLDDTVHAKAIEAALPNQSLIEKSKKNSEHVYGEQFRDKKVTLKRRFALTIGLDSRRIIIHKKNVKGVEALTTLVEKGIENAQHGVSNVQIVVKTIS